MSTVASAAGTEPRSEADDEALRRALDYPYGWPGACFAFHGGHAHEVFDRAAMRRGRTPVLAYGSNRAPAQLYRKFGSLPAASAILVERCELDGFDIVHSAHVTSYGAIPAALLPRAGVSVVVAVTWLSDAQVAQMDLSERTGRNYGRRPLGVIARLGDGAMFDAVEAYFTDHGPLHVDGEIVGQADIEARGRPGSGLRNAEVLARAHRAFAADKAFEDFVLRLARDEAYRDDITERLKAGL